jgi:hypothetical protein
MKWRSAGAAVLLVAGMTQAWAFNNPAFQPTTAADFMDLCEPLAKTDVSELMKGLQEMQKANPKQISGDDALALIALTYCTAVVSSTTLSIVAADNYELQGSKVCLDPKESGLVTLRYIVDFGKSHPDMVHDKTWDAGSFVIKALSDKSCPASAFQQSDEDVPQQPLYKCGDLYTTKEKQGCVPASGDGQ